MMATKIINRYGLAPVPQEEHDIKNHDLRVFPDEQQRQAHEKSVKAFNEATYWARLGMLDYYRTRKKNESEDY